MYDITKWDKQKIYCFFMILFIISVAVLYIVITPLKEFALCCGISKSLVWFVYGLLGYIVMFICDYITKCKSVYTLALPMIMFGPVALVLSILMIPTFYLPVYMVKRKLKKKSMFTNIKVKNFDYNGFYGHVEDGYAPYTATFVEWTNDPGVFKGLCSDGVERRIPTFAIELPEGVKFPEQAYSKSGKDIFSHPSHS